MTDSLPMLGYFMPKNRYFKFLSLENLTFLGAAIGVVIGLTAPHFALNTTLIGDLFVIFLKSMILPLILSSVFVSISQAANHLFEIGRKTFLYFLLTSALACITGLIAANLILIKPVDTLVFDNFKPDHHNAIGIHEFILSLFSDNFFRSLTQGQILPLVVFTLVAGVASTRLTPEKNHLLHNLAQAIHELTMIILQWILWLAPLGVFSLVSVSIAKMKTNDFSSLGSFFLAVSVAASIHSFITLPVLGAFLGRFSPYRFIVQIREALIVALATASSSATLPVSTRVIEAQGVSKKVSGFVLPLGATLNMNGSALYQALVVIFLGQIAGIEFSITQQFLVFLMVMLSAAGTAGIPGGGLLMMTATLQTIGIPVDLIGIYLLVDRFWDPLITMINVMDDLFAAKTIDQWVEKSK